ncbi:MAG TPA: dihydropteroate synthase, partial [Phycisphaerae bacterium]
PIVMGILNVTPDSFSDGGAYLDPEAAIGRAEQMLAEGAALIDVGPESTRPGSEPVSAEEQIRRAVPVIAGLIQRRPNAVISIDTRSAVVAAAALAAGAAIVNDISALRDDSEMAAVVARTGAGIVLMHMQGTPPTMQQNPHYADVVAEVTGFLRQRAAYAESQGMARECIAIDPGIGFGKTVEHNLALLRGLDMIVALGYPVVVGASRKSFLAKLLGTSNMAERLPGSLACGFRAIAAGARVIRVHDVLPTRSLLALF